jgi:pimeloyl-ACP methyl ester carboxylesterase
VSLRTFACAFCTAAVAAVAFNLCTAQPAALGRPGITPLPCASQVWQPIDPKFEALPGTRVFFGSYDGGLYRIEIPDHWNGELALYAHGFVPSTGARGSELRVGDSPIREHLVKRGIAWAASSYRCNGYVPGQGLVDTMALTDLFTRFNDGRKPQRVYLTGTSMGGHVTVLGMHEFPKEFAGGLAMCAAGPELFDFFAAVGAAAEVITGTTFTLGTMQDDLAKMGDMLGKPPDYTERGRQLASVEIQISGGPRPFAAEGLVSRFLGNINGAAIAGGTTPSNRAVMTTHIKYAIDEGLGLTADTLNARARRKPLDAAFRSENGPYEELVPFDGRLDRPLLTMHGTGDLFVPIFLEQKLKRAVIASGRQKLLAQRVYRIPGHCGFSQPEMISAFDDLEKWVHQGVKPESDEVEGDLRQAGMKFTQPLRPNDPGGLRVGATAAP